MRRTFIALAAAVPCVILLLPAFAAAAALLLVASCARAIGRLLEPSFATLGELVTFDLTLGWRTRPNLDTPYLAEYDDVFRMVTDDDGWPGRRSIADSQVVVIGDSFASGYGIDAGKSFADADRHLAVKAIGAPGYSMVQGVLLMEQLGARLAGKLVAWFVFLENDLQDNLVPEQRGVRAPFVRRAPDSGRWEVVTGHITPDRWTCSNLDTKRLFPHVCVPGPIADRAYGACDYLIGRAREVCRAAGANLVVVTIPYGMQLTRAGLATLARQSGRPDAFDPDLPDRRVADCCRRHGVAMVAAAQHLSRRDYKHREGIHWNARGHQRMARLLSQLYGAFRAGRLGEHTPRQETSRTEPCLLESPSASRT